MKKLLAAVMAVLGLAQSAEAEPRIMDPGEVLFSMPTIAKDLPPLERLSGPPAADAFAFHEDEWTQNEFLPKAMLPEVRRMLSEFKAFEAQNREGSGWRTYMFARSIARR
ncbi:MAG: hypothetical protein AB7F09_00405 [Parvibaculaceae bacterium]